MAQWSAHSPFIQEAGVRILVEQAEKFFFFEVTFSKMRCIKVTFRKIRVLYAVSKLLFEKPNAICCIKVTVQKN